MRTDAQSFLASWHTIVAARDLATLRTVLADDVTMGAPPYWERLQGADLIAHLLGIIIHTIEDFTYHREWVAGTELALEFRGHVGTHQLQGIDLITLGADGRIVRFDVMIRPLNALTALRDTVAPQMTAYLSRG